MRIAKIVCSEIITWKMRGVLPWTLLCLIFGLFLQSAKAQTEISANEQNIKAVFLLRLPEFIKWENKNSPKKEFNLCILAPNNYVDVFKDLDGKVTKGLSVKVHIKNISSHSFSECSLMFVGTAAEKDVKHILNKLYGSGCLIVGESEEFMHSGAAIGLVVKQNRITIEINMKAVGATGLIVGSELLKLSTII